jgi:hypothetical protein
MMKLVRRAAVVFGFLIVAFYGLGLVYLRG